MKKIFLALAVLCGIGFGAAAQNTNSLVGKWEFVSWTQVRYCPDHPDEKYEDWVITDFTELRDIEFRSDGTCSIELLCLGKRGNCPYEATWSATDSTVTIVHDTSTMVFQLKELTTDSMAIVQLHRGPIQIARNCVFGYIDSVYAYRRKNN